MYDMKLLSTYNVDNPEETDPTKVIRKDADNGKYSWLLVKGRMTDSVGADDALGVFVMNTDAQPVITRTAVEGD